MSHETLKSRARRAWNVFLNKDHTFQNVSSYGGYSYRPDRSVFTHGNERSIITAIYNRISLDVSAVSIKHVRTDDNGRYSETIDSGLNTCLTLEANLDQTHRAFIQDAVISMLDEGCVGLLPTITDGILELRTAKILEWFPDRVRVKVYDQATGRKREEIVPKTVIAIVENPFYSVMNEPNSMMQRLIHKLSLLDAIDEQSGSGKLDMIIQLPYDVRSPVKQDLAAKRMQDVNDQLNGTKYGIAYIGATEHVIQLNRAVENNLMAQIEYLNALVHSQLGITQAILDGTADESTMLNYSKRTVEPIVSALVDEMKRKFLSKTARTQHQTIMFFSNPFRLIPPSQLADIGDKMTRNEIMSSNEMRQEIGLIPSDDPSADELRNKNLNRSSADTGDKSNAENEE